MTDETRASTGSANLATQRGTVAYLLVAGIQRAASFLSLPLFAAALRPSEFGDISVLVSAGGLVIVLLPLGMETFVYRTAFLHDEGRQHEKLSSVVTFLVVGPTLVSALLGVLALAMPPILGIRPRYFAGYLLTAGLTTTASVAPMALLRARERFAGYAALSLGYAAVQFGARMWLVVILDKGVAGWVIADLTSAAVAAALGAWSARTHLTRHAHAADVRDGLRFGLPLVPHSASHWVLNLSDRFVIGVFLTSAAVGVYSMSYQVASVASIAVMEVQRAFLPRYGEVLRGDRTVEGIVAQQAVIMVGLCGLVALGGPQAVLILLPASYASAAYLIPQLAVGFACYGLYFIPMNAIVILRGETRRIWRWTTASGVVNLGLNIALVPSIGILAGALATVAGYAVLLALVFRAGAAIDAEHRLHPSTIVRPILPSVIVVAIASFGAVRPGAFGLSCATVGLVLLTAAIWFSGAVREPHPIGTAT